MDKYWAAAPTRTTLIDLIDDEIDIGDLVVDVPVECAWPFDLRTDIREWLSEAIDQALELSSLDGNVMYGNVYTVVEIGDTQTGWDILRTLPLLAFRGDLYGVLDDDGLADLMDEEEKTNE